MEGNMKRLSIYVILAILSATSFSLPTYSEESEVEKPRVAVLAFSAHNCPKTLSSAAEVEHLIERVAFKIVAHELLLIHFKL